MKRWVLPAAVLAMIASFGISQAWADDDGEREGGERRATRSSGTAGGAGGNAAICANCHKDGRSGTPPHALPAGLTAKAGTTTPPSTGTGQGSAGGSNAAICAKCHKDGRSGTPPHALPAGLTAKAGATTPPSTGAGQGSAGASNAAVCAKCHNDGRSGKAPHPIAGQDPSGGSSTSVANGKYVIIGWSDLGMHCVSPRFGEMAILPPYNDVMAQVIERGDPPRVVSGGVKVSYNLINNTTVAGKTDFWLYANALFGVQLPEGVGLTGNTLSGTMKFVRDHHEATGVPVLPYDDAKRWNPYQKAVLTVSDATGTLATTTLIVPTSDEMNCARCHGALVGTMESNILSLHDRTHGTDLMGSRPVLCSSCHADSAVGARGVQGISSLSQAMHTRHSALGAAPACYDCHPGTKTRGNRSRIEGMGPGHNGDNPNCELCHGDLKMVAGSIANGRTPWLQEPTCAQCHRGASYSTGSKLYRQSKGHGGVYCSACHNSPHAWYPSNLAEDNAQPIALQGKAGSIGNCTVCHTSVPKGGGPHR